MDYYNKQENLISFMPLFKKEIEGIYSKFFQNINITNQGVNTSSLVISNFAESIPLLITNYQNIATPNPFQQMINISVSSIDNYVNTTSFGQNVEFVYNNNSVIPSWLESYNSKYAIWWIKIPSIPAKGASYFKERDMQADWYDAIVIVDKLHILPERCCVNIIINGRNREVYHLLEWVWRSYILVVCYQQRYAFSEVAYN